jgi:hypothetical protein
MKKICLMTAFGLLTGFISVHGQSIFPSVWKAYVGEINDTVTLRLKGNESLCTSSAGDTLIRSQLKSFKDTLVFSDLDGRYVCPTGQMGTYQYTIKSDTLSFSLVTDSCESRSNISNIVWIRSKGDPAKK